MGSAAPRWSEADLATLRAVVARHGQPTGALDGPYWTAVGKELGRSAQAAGNRWYKMERAPGTAARGGAASSRKRTRKEEEEEEEEGEDEEQEEGEDEEQEEGEDEEEEEEEEQEKESSADAGSSSCAPPPTEDDEADVRRAVAAAVEAIRSADPRDSRITLEAVHAASGRAAPWPEEASPAEVVLFVDTLVGTVASLQPLSVNSVVREAERALLPPHPPHRLRPHKAWLKRHIDAALQKRQQARARAK